MCAESARRHHASAEEQMTYLTYGHVANQTVRAIADHSIADHLANGALTASEIAARDDIQLDTTQRLMRAGVAIGLMTTDSSGQFYGTQLLAMLRSDAPRRDRALTVVTAGVIRRVFLANRALRSGRNSSLR
jgi:hypothetical protein